MTTDIRLDHGRHRNLLLLEGGAVYAAATDFILDKPERRTSTDGYRRALVHDFGDALTINYNGDYPGGVTLNNARIRLRTLKQKNGKPGLPKKGVIGELLMVKDTRFMENTFMGESLTLYVCVGGEAAVINGGVSWRPIEMGKTVPGTE